MTQAAGGCGDLAANLASCESEAADSLLTDLREQVQRDLGANWEAPCGRTIQPAGAPRPSVAKVTVYTGTGRVVWHVDGELAFVGGGPEGEWEHQNGWTDQDLTGMSEWPSESSDGTTTFRRPE